MSYERTADWLDADIRAYVDFCRAIGLTDAQLLVPMTVWANESNNTTTAHNKNGDASGLCQLMPATAKGLGYDLAADPHLDAYRALSVTEQLSWCARYYANHKGRVGTVGRFYTATFLPAELESADDLQHVVCGTGGPYPWAYAANRGFDLHGRGYITVQDMVDAALRQCGPRTHELWARVRDLVPEPAPK